MELLKVFKNEGEEVTILILVEGSLQYATATPKKT